MKKHLNKGVIPNFLNSILFRWKYKIYPNNWFYWNLLTYNILFSPVIGKWYMVTMFSIWCFIISMKRDIMNIIKSICCYSVHEWCCNRHINWKNILWGVWTKLNSNPLYYEIPQVYIKIKHGSFDFAILPINPNILINETPVMKASKPASWHWPPNVR